MGTSEVAMSGGTALSADGPSTRRATGSSGRLSKTPAASIRRIVNEPSEAVKEPSHSHCASPSESSSQVQRSAWKEPSTPVSWVTSRGTATENA